MSFKQGGWLVLLAVVVFVAGGIWQTRQVLRARGEPRMGDGEHVESYGFDLSTLAVPRHLVAATSLPRDGLERLDFPPLMDVDVWLTSWSSGRHRKYLVPSDRVVGVVHDGIARAYPLRVLTWHEVVNDTLAGVPIAVTYAPLADGAVVVDRRSLAGVSPRNGAGAVDGAPEEAATGARAPLLGFSGLVYNGCPLVYGIGEGSLYSPLALRAVAGEAVDAGRDPRPLPAAVVHWSEWITAHPGTRVVEPTLEWNDRYRTDPYHNYVGNDLLEDYPVEPLLPEGERNKARVLALVTDAGIDVVPLAEILAGVGSGDTWTTSVRGRRVTLAYAPDPETAWIAAYDGASPVAVSCYRWAWHALHADAVGER